MATAAVEQPETRVRIPAPKGLPVVGHLHQIARDGLIRHLLHVNRHFPQGIFKLKFGSRVAVFVTDPDLVAELCDETRFRKMPGPGLRVVRKFAGDGLFTTFSDEPNWGKAHRILLPAFSQRAMKGYFEMMLEVADQLVAKWTRLSGTDVLVADDMTRFTLDSIAVAGFGQRFASFEREELDSFLEALGRALGSVAEPSLAKSTLSLQMLDTAATRAQALPAHAQQLQIVANDEMLYNCVVTNVPGSRVPLYFCGAKMVAMYGTGPVFDGMGLINTIYSYTDTIAISFTSDRAMMPNPHVYAEALTTAFKALKVTALAPPSTPAPSRHPPRNARHRRGSPPPRCGPRKRNRPHD